MMAATMLTAEPLCLGHARIRDVETMLELLADRARRRGDARNEVRISAGTLHSTSLDETPR